MHRIALVYDLFRGWVGGTRPPEKASRIGPTMRRSRVASPHGRERQPKVANPVRCGSRRSRMARLTSLTFALTGLLAVPATSYAGDPLLSGYGGPGGGQQVLLGAHLLHGGGGSGSGGAAGAGHALRAAVPVHVAAPTAIAVPAQRTPATPTPGSTGGARTGAAHRTASRSHRAHHRARAGTTATPSSAVAAPRRVAYPAGPVGGGGLPLTAGDLAVAALALAAMGGLGAWVRRTAAHGGSGGAQAPS